MLLPICRVFRLELCLKIHKTTNWTSASKKALKTLNTAFSTNCLTTRNQKFCMVPIISLPSFSDQQCNNISMILKLLLAPISGWLQEQIRRGFSMRECMNEVVSDWVIEWVRNEENKLEWNNNESQSVSINHIFFSCLRTSDFFQSLTSK